MVITKQINSTFLVRITCCFLTLLFIALSAHAKPPVVASYYVASANPIAVGKLPAEKLSHVLYAFIALCGDNSDANETTRHAIAVACEGKAPYSAVIYNEKEAITEFDAFRQLKKQHPHLRVLPSIGGWTLSQPFHGMAKHQAARKHFVQSAIALITQHDVFDGIDIDWEYPGGGGNSQAVLQGAQAENEKQVFTLMMQEFREGLNQLTQDTGRDYLLTAAVSGSAAKTQAIDWQQAISVMDYVFVMTYDFAVVDGRAAHHTNLFSGDEKDLSTKAMIDNLLNAGVPAHKLAVGVAFYGRGWNNSGWQGTEFGDNQHSISTGTYIYKDLQDSPPAGYVYGYDEQTQSAYLFNAQTNGFISFDDKRSTHAKAKWAKDQGLAGVFSWQILQDNGDLIDAMHQGMHQE
jgi:GH18 family chitinase